MELVEFMDKLAIWLSVAFLSVISSSPLLDLILSTLYPWQIFDEFFNMYFL